ncbi:MAG: hypothetical protein OER98_02880 [Gammaproteobacteria bacterium]|nr:hypothetical protein [Gammaproteobacteria bacterium]
MGGNAATQRGNIAAFLQPLQKAVTILHKQVLHLSGAAGDCSLQNRESEYCPAELPEILKSTSLQKRPPEFAADRYHFKAGNKAGFWPDYCSDSCHDQANDSENRYKVPIAASDNGLFHSGILIVATGCGLPEPGFDPYAN